MGGGGGKGEGGKGKGGQGRGRRRWEGNAPFRNPKGQYATA